MGAGATAARVGTAARRLPVGEILVRSISRRVVVSQCLAHLIGALDVFLLLFVVLPAPDPDPRDHLLANGITMGVLVPGGILVGTMLGRRVSSARLAWLRDAREPDPEERTRLLLLPNRSFKLNASLWIAGAAILFVVNATISVELAAHVATTTILGGLTTCGISYLLMERDLRPATDLALAAGPPARPAWPGVQGRVVLAWLLASGSPLLGLVLVGADAATGGTDVERVGLAVVALALIGLAVGFTVLVAATRTVTEPLAAVRAALARVQGGDLSAGVRIDDGSEVGLLQSGFNSMVGGLRERERLRGLYGRQVGEDVAAAALADEPRLGGEVRDVGVLFVDLIGSTALAERTPPQRVLARLNAFFAIVVEVAEAHGGWVNKFEGDGALCVFGAPQAHPEAAGAALGAARDLRARIRRELPDLDAGIGVAHGPAVAGWVGAEARFEYTVIGDPVNVAARLCVLAKSRDERVVAAESVVTRAGGDEGEAWTCGDEVTLRGRAAPTRLAVPA